MVFFIWRFKEMPIEAVKCQNSINPRKHSPIIEAYQSFRRPKIYLLIWLFLLLTLLIIWSISVGSYDMPLLSIVRAIFGLEEGPHKIVVWGIRMPRIIAALITGCGLALSGLATQSLLRNPLASPFTLGISQGAAFGAAFAIVVLNATDMQQGALNASDASVFSALNVLYETFQG